MAVLKFKNGSNWEEIKIPEPQTAVSLAGMCYVSLYDYDYPAEIYGGTWTRIVPSTYSYSEATVLIGGYLSNSIYIRTINYMENGNRPLSGTTLYVWLRTA